jgi:hypothetical protein
MLKNVEFPDSGNIHEFLAVRIENSLESVIKFHSLTYLLYGTLAKDRVLQLVQQTNQQQNGLTHLQKSKRELDCYLP